MRLTLTIGIFVLLAFGAALVVFSQPNALGPPPAYPPAPSVPHAGEVKTEFDEFTGKSSMFLSGITVQPDGAGEYGPRAYFSASSSFEGSRRLHHPSSVSLLFSLSTPDLEFGARDRPPLELLIDGEPVPVALDTRSVKSIGDHWLDHLSYKVSLDTLFRMIDSPEVKARIGSHVFTWTPDLKAALQDFAHQLAPQ